MKKQAFTFATTARASSRKFPWAIALRTCPASQPCVQCRKREEVKSYVSADRHILFSLSLSTSLIRRPQQHPGAARLCDGAWIEDVWTGRPGWDELRYADMRARQPPLDSDQPPASGSEDDVPSPFSFRSGYQRLKQDYDRSVDFLIWSCTYRFCNRFAKNCNMLSWSRVFYVIYLWPICFSFSAFDHQKLLETVKHLVF